MKYDLPKGAAPFSIEGYEAGRKVITRSGAEVKILATDRKGIQPIVALVPVQAREEVWTFSAEGIYNKNKQECKKDLILAPEEITVYYGVNIEDMITTPLFLEPEDPKVWAAKNTETDDNDWSWESKTKVFE